jgi:perosamine synthetase
MEKAESLLAINGGSPIRDTFLPYGRQAVTEDDIDKVVNILRSDFLTTGPNVQEFEEAFARSVEAKYAVSFSSGTAALHATIFAAGLGKGDEGITTPLTFCATANCLLYQGATPVFADISPRTLNLDPTEVEKNINPRTKAILPVDFGGYPADLDLFLELADKYHLTLIEDACHALGAQYKGKSIGSISHMTVFSFHPVKHITSGEGGMVVTNNFDLVNRLKIFRNHGISSEARERHDWFYEMVDLGFNYRLSDIASGLGFSQLRRLKQNVDRRRAIASFYTTALQGIEGITTPIVESEIDSGWHLYPIRLNAEHAPEYRDNVFRALRAENIGVNVHYIPVHLHPYYKTRFGYRGGEFPHAEMAFNRLLSLPLFPEMNDQDCHDVVRALEKVMGYYGGNC